MKKTLIIILVLISNLLFSQTQIDSLEALLPNKQGLEKVEILNKLAFAHWNISPAKGLDYAEMAYSIALKKDSKIDIAMSLQNMGVCCWAKSEFRVALEHYQKSLKIYEEVNDIRGICSSFTNLGIIYRDLSDYETALKYYLKSLKTAEDHGISDFQISTIGNISALYWVQKNYPKALEYVQQAIALSEKDGQSINLAANLNTMGQIYTVQNNYIKAKSTYIKCLQIDRENGDNYGMSISLYNLADTEYRLKNYASALEHYKESLLISKEIHDRLGVLLAYKGVGHIHKELNRFDAALSFYKKAMDLAIELDSKEQRLNIYNNYSELYKSVGEFDKSLNYLEKFISLKDSLYTERSSQQMAEMQIKYDSEKKENENELLRKNSEIQNLDIAKQTNLRNSFIGISLLVILMIIILLNRFKIKKKANQILTLKNEVISIQRDELKATNSTKDKFFTIISHDLKSPFNCILGFTNLLVKNYDKYDDSRKRNIINSLSESSQHAFDLLDNLLNWAQTQTGRIEINKERLNLNELIKTSIAPYKYNASKKKIEIVTNVPPGTMLSVDRNTSRTIIGNLVNNAIKFTSEGGAITINYQENGDDIELHIIDTGLGMTSEFIEKLFKIDENISSKGTNNETGSGLGLILCKEFIKKNGGDISVKSEVGKGSEFILSISK